MSLDVSEALAGKAGPAPTGRRCKFRTLLDAVPPEQAAELVARLNGKAWTDSRLARLISGTAFGYINPSALSKHRTSDCICDATTESQAA